MYRCISENKCPASGVKTKMFYRFDNNVPTVNLTLKLNDKGKIKTHSLKQHAILFCCRKSLSTFIVTCVDETRTPSASHHKYNAIPGALPSKFTMSE